MSRMTDFVAGVVVVLILLLPTFAGAQSGTISGDYVGCVTSTALSEFVKASNARDYQQMNALLQGQCRNLSGQEYSIVNQGFLTSTIRVQTLSGSRVLHVPTAAIR